MKAKIFLAGRLGRDAELKTTAKGTSVLSFSLAVDSGWGENKHTSWFNVVSFGKSNESLAKWLTKGKTVLVTGEPRLESYESKEGQRVTALKVYADDITLIGGNTSTAQQAVEAEDEGVPF
jgi:single-strand DNA-binding protein